MRSTCTYISGQILYSLVAICNSSPTYLLHVLRTSYRNTHVQPILHSLDVCTDKSPTTLSASVLSAMSSSVLCRSAVSASCESAKFTTRYPHCTLARTHGKENTSPLGTPYVLSFESTPMENSSPWGMPSSTSQSCKCFCKAAAADIALDSPLVSITRRPLSRTSATKVVESH
jgi:hypothetical protein